MAEIIMGEEYNFMLMDYPDIIQNPSSRGSELLKKMLDRKKYTYISDMERFLSLDFYLDQHRHTEITLIKLKPLKFF